MLINVIGAVMLLFFKPQMVLLNFSKEYKPGKKMQFYYWTLQKCLMVNR